MGRLGGGGGMGPGLRLASAALVQNTAALLRPQPKGREGGGLRAGAMQWACAGHAYRPRQSGAFSGHQCGVLQAAHACRAAGARGQPHLGCCCWGGQQRC